MERILCPVDVIAVYTADGEIRPLRLRIEGKDRQMTRIDIQEIIRTTDISYVGMEARVFLCRARIGKTETILEVKYAFRAHCWSLLRRVC